MSRVFRHWVHSPQRVIALFPDWFAPPQPDWPAALRLTGFPQYDESDQQQLSPGAARVSRRGLTADRLHAGLGQSERCSVLSRRRGRRARLNRRALLLTRFTDICPRFPPTAHHEGYAPLSRLLPRCAALVHHGGIGTLAQALAAGVPQLTMPMGFDQPDNTTRLLRLGVARWVAPSQVHRRTCRAAARYAAHRSRGRGPRAQSTRRSSRTARRSCARATSSRS